MTISHTYRLSGLRGGGELCCVLTPPIVKEELSLDVTQRKADRLTKEGGTIMDAPEAKGGSVIQREAVIFCLKENQGIRGQRH